MKRQAEFPPSPRLPQGLSDLVRGSHLRPAQPVEPRAIVEPNEATRAWKPDRALLQREPQRASESEFASAAEEQTMVGASNLNDPCLFRSEPPPAALQNAPAKCSDGDDDVVIEFVGSLMDPNRDERDEAQPTMASVWGDEKTRLYRPQRSHLTPQEPSDEFDEVLAATDAAARSPEPPKVIISPAALADSAPDPTRAEATKKKKKHRARRGGDTRLGLAMCVVGGLALAFSAAWRHPRTAPVTQHAFARATAVAAGLWGR